MQQYLILGIGGFGGAVLDRVRALPLEKNIVYHRVECGPDRPVATHYLQYRQQMLDVLNREVYNFANTQLTVYLVGLLVEAHMAENLMHLGYLFKSFFRENIILNPRVKVLISALPTILPEEAYAWLPATKKVLDRSTAYAALKDQFQPRVSRPQAHAARDLRPALRGRRILLLANRWTRTTSRSPPRRRRPRSTSTWPCCRRASRPSARCSSSTAASPRASRSLRSRAARSPSFPRWPRCCATRWNTSS